MTDQEILDFLTRQVNNHAGENDLHIRFDINFFNNIKDPAFENYKSESLIAKQKNDKEDAEEFKQQLERLDKDPTTHGSFLVEDSEKTETEESIPTDVNDDLANKLCYTASHFIGNFILKVTRKKNKSLVRPKLIAFDNGKNHGFELIIKREEINHLRNSLLDFKPNLDKFINNLSFTAIYMGGFFSFVFNKISGLMQKLFSPRLIFYNPSYFLVPPEYPSESLEVYLPDGTFVDAVVIKSTAKISSREYIIHCNKIHQEYSNGGCQKHTIESNVNTVLVNYSGSGLGLGSVYTQKYLYGPFLSVAKKLVDDGAAYILINGASLGGYVAPIVASKLLKYCKKQNKDVQVELVSVSGFTSIKDMIIGLLREIDLSKIFSGDFARSSVNVFKKVLGGMLTPILSLITYIIGWDMNAKNAIKTLPKANVDVVGLEGDTVIGDYASIESQLRKENKNDVKKLKKEKLKLENNRIHLKNYQKKMEILENEIKLKSSRYIKNPISGLREGQLGSMSTCTHDSYNNKDRFNTFFNSRNTRKVFRRKTCDEVNNFAIANN
jgi:hypothetical protein